MIKIPTTQVVRDDGLIELPIVLDFDFSNPGKVVGYAVVDPDLLPLGSDYCFNLGYVRSADGQITVTCLSVVKDDQYFKLLQESGY